MPLAEFDLPDRRAPLPSDVRAFLREARRRIDRFQRTGRAPGFVPSDYAGAYRVLRALTEDVLAPSGLFCEWGSGFGVVAGLAALLGFDAFGIEVEGELVDAARRLADDFGLPVEFARGSFIPEGAGACLGDGAGFAWLTTDPDRALDEFDLAPDDFSVVFAYPWPDEEQVTADLFERSAAAGAVLVTYHGGDEFRLRRKTSRRAFSATGRHRPPR